jgi:hypothetical protein
MRGQIDLAVNAVLVVRIGKTLLEIVLDSLHLFVFRRLECLDEYYG